MRAPTLVSETSGTLGNMSVVKAQGRIPASLDAASGPRRWHQVALIGER